MSVRQYGRLIKLTISTRSGNTLDMSLLKINFSVKRGDIQTPNTATVTIYNPNMDTANAIISGSTDLTLEAGYEGNFGIIFSGKIKQRMAGREDQLNTYVEVVAVDGDHAYNFSALALSLSKGTTPQDAVQRFIAGMVPYGITQGASVNDLKGNGSIRGQSFFGLTRDEMRVLAEGRGYRWSIQNGEVTLIPLKAYLNGQIPEVSPASGLIGIPQQTESGITLRVLLNPSIKIGQLVKITNATINKFKYGTDINQQAQNAQSRLFNQLNKEGNYYVMGVDYVGDMRGQEWYSDLTCLSIDASVPPDQVPRFVDSYAGSAVLDANFGPESAPVQ